MKIRYIATLKPDLFELEEREHYINKCSRAEDTDRRSLGRIHGESNFPFENFIERIWLGN